MSHEDGYGEGGRGAGKRTVMGIAGNAKHFIIVTASKHWNSYHQQQHRSSKQGQEHTMLPSRTGGVFPPLHGDERHRSVAWGCCSQARECRLDSSCEEERTAQPQTAPASSRKSRDPAPQDSTDARNQAPAVGAAHPQGGGRVAWRSAWPRQPCPRISPWSRCQHVD